MKRLTAALLLLFAFAGTFIPLAQAASLAPNHACCLRKAPHQYQCHGSGSADQLSFSSASCCTHDCCRAATTSQVANLQGRIAVAVAAVQGQSLSRSHSPAPAGNLSESQSTRAPPTFLC